MPDNVNVTPVRDELERAIRAQLDDLLVASTAQLDGPIRQAAGRLAVAARRGRRDLVDECRDQLELAIVERKIHARAGMERVLDFVLERGLGMLFDGATAGLLGLVRK